MIYQESLSDLLIKKEQFPKIEVILFVNFKILFFRTENKVDL